MNDDKFKNAENIASQVVNSTGMEFRPARELPKKLEDLDDKKYLIVYDTQGQTYEGTKVKLVYNEPEWVLTIQLLSTEAFKSFNDSEISSITRCT
jgi:hypothetical protein